MPAGDLTLTTETVDDVGIIGVIGELDLSNVATLDAALADVVAARRVIVVLAECTFLDSSALRSIVRAQQAAVADGGGLALVAPTQPARRVLEVAALDRFILIFETLAEAITAPN